MIIYNRRRGGITLMLLGFIFVSSLASAILLLRVLEGYRQVDEFENRVLMEYHWDGLLLFLQNSPEQEDGTLDIGDGRFEFSLAAGEGAGLYSVTYEQVGKNGLVLLEDERDVYVTPSGRATIATEGNRR